MCGGCPLRFEPSIESRMLRERGGGGGGGAGSNEI